MRRRDAKRLSRPPGTRPSRNAPELADPLPRIGALIGNARNTWFVLLGVLVFIIITLMGVEHVDFWGVDRQTKLPLVNVEVPTRYFFVAAPVLLAAVFGYFHLYLIRLWDALGAANASQKGQPLGDAISPWLVTDAALYWRQRRRRDSCTAPRQLEGPSMVLNVLLAWAVGLCVSGAIWWMSMPARTLWLTSVAAVCLLASLAIAATSLAMLLHRMGRNGTGTVNIWRAAPFAIGLAAAIFVVAPLSWVRTSGPAHYLAPVSLVGANIVEKPSGWLLHHYAKAEFLVTWCRREGIDDCKELRDRPSDFGAEWDELAARSYDFETEWKTRRATTIADLNQPKINRISKEQAFEDRLDAIWDPVVPAEDEEPLSQEEQRDLNS